jgi:S-DNA-T family DNA segregation ATPase FtsK/SpoIIIE
MTKNIDKDVAMIALKCQGLGFPVFYKRSERGPRVTTHFFTQQVGSTAPLSKVINRSEDLAFACGVSSVMITRVLNEIAIQVPLDPEDVTLIKFDSCIHTLLTSGVSTQQLPLCMGQTVQGENFTVDLAEQPHILIAGSTGGGKSVFQAALVCGLILAKSPEELDLYLVDTKQLDLPLFKGVKHVKAIVDKIEKVHDLLDNLILNVRRRTERMKGVARNIAEFNKLQLDPVYPYPNKFPAMKYKVLVIDELADIISQDIDLAKREPALVEVGVLKEKRTRIVNKIQTLTQISRASGIHVIAATQRPSVKLMSGDIKANFPMRLTFRLPTSADSRVILGEGGAENLLGKGDYLYQTYDMPSPVRSHGAFVTTNDIARIIDINADIRSQYAIIRAAITAASEAKAEV